MNKKLNTFLFLVVTTIFYVVVFFALLVLGLFLYARLLAGVVPKNFQSPAIVIVMLLCIGGVYFFYDRLIQALDKKYDLEKYLHPIFRPRGRRKP